MFNKKSNTLDYATACCIFTSFIAVVNKLICWHLTDKFCFAIYPKDLTPPYIGEHIIRIFWISISGLFYATITSLIVEILYYKPLKKVIYAIFYITILLSGIIDCGGIFQCRTRICPILLRLLLNADFSEIKGYFNGQMDFNVLLYSGVITVVAFVIWHLKNSFYKHIVKNKNIYIILFGILYLCTGHGKSKSIFYNKNYPPFVNFVISAYNSNNIYGKYGEMLVTNKDNNVEITENKNDLSDIIFIIGESESRHFMGLYNESYNTTPLCQKMVEQKNMTVFTDVISPQSLTILVMPFLLSFYDIEAEYNKTPFANFPPIIDAFNKADYNTFWISNQSQLSILNSYVDYQASKYKYAHFIQGTRKFSDIFSLNINTDDKILPVLDNYLTKYAHKDNKNFIAIELFGSHFFYKERYPAEYDVFKENDIPLTNYTTEEKEIVAYYMNSILFTDHILNEIISRFINRNAIVLYVSDHGEELFQNNVLGHYAEMSSKYMCEIPMMIWESDLFIKNHPELHKQIQASSNLPFMTDNIAHVLMDLAQIKTQQYDSTKSLISKNYIIRERYPNQKSYNKLKNRIYKKTISEPQEDLIELEKIEK